VQSDIELCARTRRQIEQELYSFSQDLVSQAQRHQRGYYLMAGNDTFKNDKSKKAKEEKEIEL
jgi:hypothetical protein